MKKIIAIISGDPNSINSEIIAKAWKRKNSFKNLNVFIIGSFVLLKKQLVLMGYNIRLKKINEITDQNFKKNLLVYDVPLKFKNPFKISTQNKSSQLAELITRCWAQDPGSRPDINQVVEALEAIANPPDDSGVAQPDS